MEFYLRHIWIACICLSGIAYSATSGDVTTSANVGQLINIDVAAVASLGDIRTTDYVNHHIMTVTVDNNDDDGYTLTFQSENGTTFQSDNSFGYLLHTSAFDDTSVIPNMGQRPSNRYELVMGENDGSTVEYGHTQRPVNLAEDCTNPGSAALFSVSTGDGHDVIFNMVDRATRQGVFEVCLSQVSDPQLFHGNFSDTIIVSIADN